MNRDCYHQHQAVERIEPQEDVATPRGWTRSVDMACTKWLLDRGIPLPSPHLLTTDVPSVLADARDVQAH